MTRFCPIRRLRPAKNPFVFKGRLFGFASFSKFILGRNGGNQCVAAQKIWNHRFWDFPASLRPSLYGLGPAKKQPSTIPYFQKQFVVDGVARGRRRGGAGDHRNADMADKGVDAAAGRMIRGVVAIALKALRKRGVVTPGNETPSRSTVTP